jgi:hypothetical protein
VAGIVLNLANIERGKADGRCEKFRVPTRKIDS